MTLREWLDWSRPNVSLSVFFFTRAWVERTIGSLRLHSLFMRQWSNVGVLFLDGGYCSVVYCTRECASRIFFFFVCVAIEKVAVYVRRRPHDKLIFAHSLVPIEFVHGSLVRPPAKTRKQSEQANFLAVRLIVLRPPPPFLFVCICIAASMADGRPVWGWGEKSKQSATSMNHCLPTAGIIICTHTKR